MTSLDGMMRVPREETMTISVSEMRYKNDALWFFVNRAFPFASGNLDKYLPVAIEYTKWKDSQRVGL